MCLSPIVVRFSGPLVGERKTDMEEVSEQREWIQINVQE